MTTAPSILWSGMWAGQYEQMGRAYPQRLKLEFADGLIRGDGIDGLGMFVVEGEYRADADRTRLGSIKTYERAHSVLYLGDFDGRVIRGQWSLPGASGNFELAPAAGGDGV
jgi:hypothetical protein